MQPRPSVGVFVVADAGCVRDFVLPRILCIGQFVEGGASAISNVTHQLNDDIRDREVRLIGSGGEQLGIMSAEDALRIADEKGLDLVKISPQATPPVCKLMDYGKFRFERSEERRVGKEC